MTDNIENTSVDTDEISLIDLAAVLWKYRIFIIVTVVLAMVGVVAFSVISIVLPPEKSPFPNEYTPESLMLINEGSNSSGGLSSVLASSGLGSLAGLAGVSGGGGTSNGQLAQVICGTNSFLDSVVDRFDLIERWEIEKSVRASSRTALKKVLIGTLDDETGVFSLKYTDIDPVFAEQVTNYATELLESRFKEMKLDQNQLKKENLEASLEAAMAELLRLEGDMQSLELGRAMPNPTNIPRITLEAARITREIEVQELVYKEMRQEYELTKITMDSETPVFQVLEYAEVPDQKSGPSRGMLCVIVTFAAGFLSVFLAFLFNAIKNIKNDPDAMSKFRGNNVK
ncbi:MAG: lipopolysaccharide biosynthesis protein [Spirochaetaceae bacterium]|jgi:uncharacterized protein involved in exopolysaccharide biosynthesis|nr:lipopolysaccharide biosynthesis protein [Spirochaetaceae bacterium]